MDFVLAHVQNTALPLAQKAAWYVLIEAGDTEAEAGLAAAMEQLLAEAFERNLVGDAVMQAYPDASVMMVGHVGDGNIHVVVLFPHARFKHQAEFEAASDEIDDMIDGIATRLGGSITAEHGVGYTYRARLAKTKPALELELMRAIKDRLDPADVMNPGKIV